jgi:hypothetical protein
LRVQASEKEHRDKGLGLELELQALKDAEQQLENIIQKLVGELAKIAS